MIYFLKGKLPWSHLKESQTILQKKLQTNLDELCEGTPEEFKEFFKHAKNLEFEEKPDYDYLNGLLLKAAKTRGINLDEVEYDWEILFKKNKESEERSIYYIDNEKNEANDDNINSINMGNDNEKQININKIIDDDGNINGEKNNKTVNELVDEINEEKNNDIINKEEEKDINYEGNNNIINKSQNEIKYVIERNNKINKKEDEGNNAKIKTHKKK